MSAPAIALGLDDRQREAVGAPGGPLLILAGAGSGKTRVLTERAAALIAGGPGEGSAVLAITFTNAAADELRARLVALIGAGARERVTVGTFHAVCHRLVRAHAERIGRSPQFTIYDAHASRRLIAGVLKEAALDEALEARLVGEQISRAKARLVDAAGYAALATSPRARQIAEAYARYEQALADNDALDFDDLLVQAVALLGDAALAARWRARWGAVLVDEYQDTNPAQEAWLARLGGPAPNLTVVGDPQQAIYCQPPGTRVTIPDGTAAYGTKEVAIEDLDAGDKVVAYKDRRVFLAGRPITATRRTRYEGWMHQVTLSDGSRSTYTENHHCVIRLDSGLGDKHVVYLMRRGEQFRIGHTPVDFGSQGRFGPNLCAEADDADDVWLLSVHETRQDAAMAEALAWTVHGIPGVCFKASYGEHTLGVERFWSRLGANRAAAERCLAAHGRLMAHPFLSRRRAANIRVGLPTALVTVAANLLPGMLMLPLASCLRSDRHSQRTAPRQAWRAIEHIERTTYCGDVVSLEVADCHTYFADGVLTHNSFRGADVGNLLGFEGRFPGTRVVALARNYRSTAAIVGAAARLAHHATGGQLVRMWTDAPRGPAVSASAHGDEREEAQQAAIWCATLLQRGAQAGQIAVLVRTRAQLRPVEDSLLLAGVTCRVLGGQGLWETAAVRDLVACLTLVHNPRDRLALGRALGTQPGVGTVAIARVLGATGEHDGDLLAACAHAAAIPRLGGPQRLGVETLGRALIELAERLPERGIAATTADTVVATGLAQRLRAQATEHAEEQLEALRRVCRAAAQYERETQAPTLAEFLAAGALATSGDEHHGDGRVTLATLHAAKGAEWDHVRIVGLCEGLLPHHRSLEDGHIDEERRLAYVGITRARHELCLTWPQRHRGRPMRMSRFVTEAGLALPAPDAHDDVADNGAARRAA